MSLTREAREYFKKDLFATKVTGVVIEEADVNMARCSLALTPDHMNTLSIPMGGAIYTLADLTFAIASNIGGIPTVTMTTEITFRKPSKGRKLYSSTEMLSDDGRDCWFLITITDDENIHVADVKMHGRRLQKKQKEGNLTEKNDGFSA